MVIKRYKFMIILREFIGNNFQKRVKFAPMNKTNEKIEKNNKYINR